MVDVREHVRGIDGGLVVGYDGSENGFTALCWAVEDARRRRARLTVLRAWTLSSALHDVAHPFGSVPSMPELEAALRADTEATLAESDTTGVDVDVLLVHASPTKALLAASERADLLVVGMRGEGGFAGLRLGSSAMQLASHADCTVVVVRPPRGRPEAQPAE